MADDENQRDENAFNTLVSITEKSGNLRKDLKNDILETVSTLRKVFSKMKTQLENRSEGNKKLTEGVNDSNGRNGENERQSTRERGGAISGPHSCIPTYIQTYIYTCIRTYPRK